jgi:hypothetical protein
MKQVKEQPTEADYECNYAFLLKEFNNAWEKNPKDISQYKALIEKAKNSQMSARQIEGVVDRCRNVINGSYGNSKAGITFTSPQESKK